MFGFILIWALLALARLLPDRISAYPSSCNEQWKKYRTKSIIFFVGSYIAIVNGVHRLIFVLKRNYWTHLEFNAIKRKKNNKNVNENEYTNSVNMTCPTSMVVLCDSFIESHCFRISFNSLLALFLLKIYILHQLLIDSKFRDKE